MCCVAQIAVWRLCGCHFLVVQCLEIVVIGSRVRVVGYHDLAVVRPLIQVYAQISPRAGITASKLLEPSPKTYRRRRRSAVIIPFAIPAKSMLSPHVPRPATDHNYAAVAATFGAVAGPRRSAAVSLSPSCSCKNKSQPLRHWCECHACRSPSRLRIHHFPPSSRTSQCSMLC